MSGDSPHTPCSDACSSSLCLSTCSVPLLRSSYFSLTISSFWLPRCASSLPTFSLSTNSDTYNYFFSVCRSAQFLSPGASFAAVPICCFSRS